jgi:hypothetical protein
MSVNLGCDFFRDEDGRLCFAPRKCVEKSIESHKRIFGSKPETNVTSQLEKGDHPEIDMTDFLDVITSWPTSSLE